MWPFDSLVSSLQTSFSKASTDYNLVHDAARRLELENEKLGEQGVIVTGMKRMITNRYNGAMTMGTLWDKSREGALWAYYFGASPNLQQDVRRSAEVWAYSRLTLPNLSFTGVARVMATSMGTTSRDLQRLQDGSQLRVRREGQFLAASVASSMLISGMLKRSSNMVQNQYGKLFLQGARRSWQASGVLALAYGLGRIHDAIQETGPFAADLRQRRDEFVQVRGQEFAQRMRPMLEHMEKHRDDPWL